MPGPICLVGSFDTKGIEYAFLRLCLEEAGHRTFLVDTGILAPPAMAVDVSAEQVCSAGGGDLPTLARKKDRGEAVAAISRGLSLLLPRLHREGRFTAVIALGGTGGTAVASAGMRELPLGVPKVMVSTVAGSDVSPYVGISDIVMVPSIVDVAGLNSISREVFTRAAAIVGAMNNAVVKAGDTRPLVAISMFGNTTMAATTARQILEGQGYEVLVFHCTGNGGRTMEALCRAGKLAGVLDLTTTEWADELVGGVFRAGPSRLSAAAETGTPAIVTPGCLDMVNFWAPETVPQQFKGRTFYPHNPNVTLMRTNAEECARLGRIFAEKLNASRGTVTVLLPLKGWSMIDAPGGPFWLPEANEAFRKALRDRIEPRIPILEFDANINEEVFARACASELLDNMRSASSKTSSAKN